MHSMPMGSTYTLGAELERDRLEHRVARLAAAVTALRQRANEYRRGPEPAPRHLELAIADFEAQVAVIDTRLRELDTEPPSAETRRGRSSDEHRQ
jgi:hypothetical protein